MTTSIHINDDLMKKLEQKSNKTGLKISELVENYLYSGLDNTDNDDVLSLVNFDSMHANNGLESIIGIAKAGYTDNVLELKKDSRRF
ncbi:MAG: CopG family transcriptional regulator [Methanosphaera stadtmanae]|nr:CopG family transcriptional regulator [Methanosphaera stadtmanae]